MPVEAARPADREAVLAVAAAAGPEAGFTPLELTGLAAQLDAALIALTPGAHRFLVYRAPAGHLAGFTGWRPTPLSNLAADLTCLAVLPGLRRQGVGAARRDGRGVLAVWISGRPARLPAHHFFERRGCRFVARIADYYDRGDDLVVFMLPLTSQPSL